MEKCEDKTMTVKEELGNLLEKLMKGYEITAEGYPLSPRRKDVDPILYIGEPDTSGWCKWKPLEQASNEEFLSVMNVLNIEINQDVVQYFTSYYFFNFDIKFKSYVMGINDIAPGDKNKRLKMGLESFRDNRDGKIKLIPIGMEEGIGHSVVVEVKTGIVKLFDSENGKMRKIAPGLQEFLKNSEPIVM